MQVPSHTPAVASQISVAVTKLELDGQAAQGQAANQLIEAAGQVSEQAVAREAGVGRRVDVDA